jgi:hypothetical protein
MIWKYGLFLNFPGNLQDIGGFLKTHPLSSTYSHTGSCLSPPASSIPEGIRAAARRPWAGISLHDALPSPLTHLPFLAHSRSSPETLARPPFSTTAAGRPKLRRASWNLCLVMCYLHTEGINAGGQESTPPSASSRTSAGRVIAI